MARRGRTDDRPRCRRSPDHGDARRPHRGRRRHPRPRSLRARTTAQPTPATATARWRSAKITKKQAAFHDAMRKLWEDHITWTRLAIVSFAHDLPDLPATEARLLDNQADIGNAIKPYYGKAAGNQLTALLKEHITGAVALLAAAKAGDQDAHRAAQRRVVRQRQRDRRLPQPRQPAQLAADEDAPHDEGATSTRRSARPPTASAATTTPTSATTSASTTTSSRWPTCSARGSSSSSHADSAEPSPGPTGRH